MSKTKILKLSKKGLAFVLAFCMLMSGLLVQQPAKAASDVYYFYCPLSIKGNYSYLGMWANGANAYIESLPPYSWLSDFSVIYENEQAVGIKTTNKEAAENLISGKYYSEDGDARALFNWNFNGSHMEFHESKSIYWAISPTYQTHVSSLENLKTLTGKYKAYMCHYIDKAYRTQEMIYDSVDDTVAPEVDFKPAASLNDNQRLDISISDSSGILAYKFMEPYASSKWEYLSGGTSFSVSRYASQDGTYSVIAKDMKDNISVAKRIHVHELTIDPNGGSYSYNGKTYTKPLSVYRAEGSAVNLLIPTRDGYRFDSWGGSPAGTYVVNSSKTLTANWVDTEKPSVKTSCEENGLSQNITFSAKDNDNIAGTYFGTSSSPADSEFETSSGTSVSKTYTVSEKGKYYFIVKDGGGNMASASVECMDVTLDPNGGKVTFDNVEYEEPFHVVRAKSQTITLPVPKKDGGFTCSGWNGHLGSYTVTDDAILTANWYDSEKPVAAITTKDEDKIGQTVVLSGNDNVGVDAYYFGTNDSPDSSDFEKVPTVDNVLEGSTGWGYETVVKKAGTYYLFVRDKEGNVSDAKSITIHSLSLDAAKGTFTYADKTYCEDALTIYRVRGAKFTLPTPTRKGYTFKGWGNETEYTFNQSKKLSAGWEIDTYNLHYDLNGGTVVIPNPTTYTVETNDFTLNNPTREGYSFDGWVEGDGEPTTTFTVKKGTVGNKIITAKWTKLYEYDSANNTITFYQDSEEAATKAFSAHPDVANITLDSAVTTMNFIDLTKYESLKNVAVSSLNPVYASENGILYNKEKTKLLLCPKKHTDNPEISKSCTSIEQGAFRGCTGITEITFPYSVKRVSEQAFDGCAKLEEITIKNPNCSLDENSVPSTVILNAFKDSGVIDYCRNHNVEYHYITEIGASYFEDEVTMTSFVVPDNITNIGSRAFAGCVNLERINLNETSVISDNAFVNAGLTEIQIPSSVTEIGNKAFYNNSELASLEFKGDSTLTTIGESAFAKTKLVDVVVPKSVATISRGAFNISTLEAIGFDGMNTELAWDESNVAVSKNAIMTVYAGSKACEYAIAHKHPLILKVGYEADGVTSYERNEGIIDKLVAIDVGPNLTTIGNQAFEGAKNLSEVMFDEKSTLTTLGDNAFAGTALTEISLPESVTAIGKEAFAECESLKTVSLGNVKVIPDGAFRGCLALADIANGNTFTTIGANAFRGTALETFTGGSALTRIGENAFADSALKKLTIENPNTVFPEGTLIPEGAVIRGYTNSTADLYSQTYLNTSCESTGKPAYQITFNTQGGQGGTERIYAVNGEELSSITVPTKTDCAFDGYYTSANGGGTKYFDADGKAVKTWTGTANATLYANWIHDSYTVVYDKNGGSGDMDADVFDTNTKYNLSQNKFTKGESRFVGWSTDKDAKTANLMDKAEVKNLANAGETVTLYAVWKSANYTVNFHSNNGSGVSVSQTIGSDKKTALKKNAFEKEGSTFIGWSTSSEAEKPEFYDEEVVENLADYGESIDLYAVWSLGVVEVYTVKFNPNGGSMEALSIAGYKGYELKVPNVDVTRTGFAFAGWSKEKGSSVADYRAGDVMDEENMTLYAVWETKGTTEYSVVIHTQKADGTYDSSTRTMTADVDTEVTLVPECDFVVPNGYYVDANQSELTKTIGENTIFNIYLNRMKTKVTYNVNADHVRMDDVTQEGALWGSTVTLDAPMPERDGYIFVGWGETDHSEEPVTQVVLGVDGTTVYAIWKEDSATPTPTPVVTPTPTPVVTPTPTPAVTPTATPTATNEPTPTATATATPTATPLGEGDGNNTVTSPAPSAKISIIPDGIGKSGSTLRTVSKVTYKASGSYATVSKVSNSAKSVTIGKTVTINGKKYKVKAIAKNAFKGKKKLKKIVIRSPYLTKVGKNAFKGISKKAKIYVPKKQYKKYKKLIAKKSTGYVKTMSIKKK